MIYGNYSDIVMHIVYVNPHCQVFMANGCAVVIRDCRLKYSDCMDVIRDFVSDMWHPELCIGASSDSDVYSLDFRHFYVDGVLVHCRLSVDPADVSGFVSSRRSDQLSRVLVISMNSVGMCTETVRLSDLGADIQEALRSYQGTKIFSDVECLPRSG